MKRIMLAGAITGLIFSLVGISLGETILLMTGLFFRLFGF